jgi:hypothetical protein
MSTTTAQTQYVDEIGAEKIVPFSRHTLRTKRCRGGGPPFYKPDGRRVMYRVDELIAWVEATRRLPPKL